MPLPAATTLAPLNPPAAMAIGIVVLSVVVAAKILLQDEPLKRVRLGDFLDLEF